MKILLIFIITKGIKYIYNAYYQTRQSYSINIRVWSKLDELYHIFSQINSYLLHRLFEKKIFVENIINSYFTKDECVQLLFKFMTNYISIYSKKSIPFINEFIY